MDNKPGITKVKWEKVDKEWYEVVLRENISSIKHKLVTGDTPIGENILKTCEIMKSAAITSSSNKAIFKSKPKLKVWTNEIKTAISNSRSKYKIWRDNGKPSEVENINLQEKKKAKRYLRKTIHIEQAKKRNKEKELILETKTKDMKLFHKLVRNNRKKGIDAITELCANGKDYKGKGNVVKAFQDHFRKLATFSQQGKIDSPYHNMVDEDIETLNVLARNRNVTAVNADEITKAIKSVNKGKSADFHGITIEHIIFVGGEMEVLILFINSIFEYGEIPEILKMGLLSPVYKNKGTKQQASNYRGITVLPVISKIIETIIKNRTQKLVLKTQNRTQRGFIHRHLFLVGEDPVVKPQALVSGTRNKCLWFHHWIFSNEFSTYCRGVL
jgi:hypothetical protein